MQVLQEADFWDLAFVPPRTVYRDFQRSFLSELLKDYESADQDLLMVHTDSVAPRFLPAFWEFSNKAFPEQWIGKRGPTAWPAPYSDLISLQFRLWRTYKVHFLRCRSPSRPGHTTLNI